MDLIERYIYAVGKKLPRKQRADIGKELTSLIMDELDARTGNGEPGTADVTAVLMEMGPPGEVAARYTERGRYLIGPVLYPTYIMVAGIMSGAVLLALTISMLIGFIGSRPDAGEALLQVGLLIPRFIMAAVSGLGFMTIAFAIIERFMPEKEIKSLKDEAAWDPEQLPQVPAKYDETKPWEEILGIVLTVAAIVVFNAFPDVIGIYCIEGESCVPVLSREALAYYLPFWNVVWGLSIGKSGLLLYRGRWELGTRIYDISLSILNIAVLAVMIAGPRFLNETAINMIRGVTSVHILDYMRSALVLGLFAAIVVTGVETGRKVYRLIRDRVQASS